MLPAGGASLHCAVWTVADHRADLEHVPLDKCLLAVTDGVPHGNPACAPIPAAACQNKHAACALADEGQPSNTLGAYSRILSSGHLAHQRDFELGIVHQL